MDTFNLRKYLVENKRTTNSKILSEAQENDPKALARKVNAFIEQSWREGVEEFKADEKEFGPNQHFGEEDMTYDLVPEDWEGEDLWVVTDGDRGGWSISVQVYDEDDDEPDEDFVLMSVLDGVIYDEDGKPYTTAPINEASYFDRYDSEASKKVGRALTTIVDIFNKSAKEENREVEEMIAVAEKETGTEVTWHEKRSLMQHKDWIRTNNIRMER